MDFITNFPLFTIVLSLFSGALCFMLKAKAAKTYTVCFEILLLTLNICVLVYTLKTGTSFTYTMGEFPAPWGNEIRAGVLEAFMAVSFVTILLCSVLAGYRFVLIDMDESKINLYYALINLLTAALMALIWTNDIFTGYVFLEILTLTSCGILIVREIGRTTLAAVRYMIMNLLGSGLFLLGVVLLYDLTGHLLMVPMQETIKELSVDPHVIPVLTMSVAILTIGLSIKSGLFPFHFWMPDTYGYATPSSSGILSGLISKGYIFFLIKIIFDVFGTEVFYGSGVHNVLFAFGAMGIVVGSVSAMRENDIFRMIAYSSAAQIGYIYMGVGISPTAGMLADLFHILTHAVTKPPLFLAAARLCDTAGGRKRFADLQGAAWSNHFAGAAFTAVAFSMIGLPLTMGFISKYLFALAAFRANVKMVPTLIILALSTVLNTLYFARTVLRIYGHPAEAPAGTLPVRAQRSYAAAAVLFALSNFAVGVAASPLIDILEHGLAMF